MKCLCFNVGRDGILPVNLNNFIPKGSPWYLQAASSVNDLGEIVGYGLINGEVHAFLATPASGAFDAAFDSGEIRRDAQSAATAPARRPFSGLKLTK
jgi:probable HAF family extracellular repeat protein